MRLLVWWDVRRHTRFMHRYAKVFGLSDRWRDAGIQSYAETAYAMHEALKQLRKTSKGWRRI